MLKSLLGFALLLPLIAFFSINEITAAKAIRSRHFLNWGIYEHRNGYNTISHSQWLDR
jgi:hypothetical protein